MPAHRTRATVAHEQAANLHLEEKGPAEAATSPDRGSNNPEQESAVNTAKHTPAPSSRATRNFREAFKDMDDPIERAHSFAHLLDTLVMIAEEDGEDNATRTHEDLIFVGRETFLAVAAIHGRYHELWNEHHDREFAEAQRRMAP